MVDKNNMEVGFMDFKELEDSTVIHIRGLKLQLAVAYATLEAAKKGVKDTKKSEDEETCEQTKTEDADTNQEKSAEN